MKYEAGDRVKVKNDVNLYKEYRGEQLIIEKCDSSDGTYLCHFTTDGYRMWFSEEMLEPVYAEGGFCNGFIDGKIPTPEKPIPIEEQLGLPKGVSIHDIATHELWTTPFTTYKDQIDSLVDAWAKLGCASFNLMTPNKEDKPMKIIFYTVDGYRIDKSNNSKVETITTKVDCIFGDLIYSGSATCDKSNYNQRQGVLEAVANALFNGKFDREYNRAVKENKDFELARRTCNWCGKVFDTVEERSNHEAWHIERKKARHERYLLRKRAKEIAFEEQAQKMAKEIIAEDNKK